MVGTFLPTGRHAHKCRSRISTDRGAILERVPLRNGTPVLGVGEFEATQNVVTA